MSRKLSSQREITSKLSGITPEGNGIARVYNWSLSSIDPILARQSPLKYISGVQIISTIKSPCGIGLGSIQYNLILCCRNDASQCRRPTSLEQWPQHWDNSHMQFLRILPVPLGQLSQAIFTDDADIIVIMVPDNVRRQYP